MWVLPTYGRARRCQQTLDSIIDVGTHTRGLVIVDGDRDPAYRALRLPLSWHIEFRDKNIGLLAGLNEVFARFPNEPWYGVINDDMIVKTPRWDEKLVEAASTCNFASANDEWIGTRGMGGATVFGGDLIRTLGWWAPPGFWHCYADNAWKMIADAAGNWIYLADVATEHRHHHNGKAPHDATYRHDIEKVDADHRVFQAFVKNDLGAAIARVQALCAQSRLPTGRSIPCAV